MNTSDHHRGYMAVLSAALAVGLAAFAWMSEPPAPPKRSALGAIPYTIAQKTTWITEPLRPDGTVDYVAALNARLSEGVTPENNAAVLLMQVMGSGVIEPEIREEFYRLLGVPLPETTEGLLQGYGEFLDENLKEEDVSAFQPEGYFVEGWDKDELHALKRRELRKKLIEESWELGIRPWTREESPYLTQWLDENKSAYELIVAGASRPRMYIPIVARNNSDLLSSLMVNTRLEIPNLFYALRLRAMSSLGERNPKNAMRDLFACHRLASLTANKASSINFYSGTAIDSSARAGDSEFAKSENVSSTDLAEYRRELATLPPYPPMSEVVDLGERCSHLNRIICIASHCVEFESEIPNEASYLSDWIGSCPQQDTWKKFFHLKLDWDLVLQIGNERHDQIVAALKLPRFDERIAGLRKIKAELMQLRKQAVNPIQISLLLSGHKPKRAVISREFGNELILEWMAGILVREEVNLFEDLAEAEIRASLRRQTMFIALALAEYQRDFGTYPKELSELSPKYIETMPLDGFVNQPLKYRLQDGGYILYSVGPNGRDDNGNHADLHKDHPKADDFTLRVPSEQRT